MENTEQNYPSLELAYPLAIASYDSIIKRIDALDGRIQTLMSFAVTVCLAVPVFGRTQNITLNSRWFISGMALLTGAIMLSTYARFYGSIGVLNPVILYQKTLHLPQEQFKVDIVHAAAKAYENNKSVLKNRWRLSVLAAVIFALALLMLVVWAAGNQT